MRIKFFILTVMPVLLILGCSGARSLTPASSPQVPDGEAPDGVTKKTNILFIIADDLGVGEIPGYSVGATKPSMPNIEALVDSGLSFENVWAYPVCSPTRASVLTGKYAHRTGVTDATLNSELDASEMTIFKQLEQSNSDYASAVFGKWHVSKQDVNGPENLGVSEFRGLLTGAASDYYSWNLTDNGSSSTFNGYITTKITDMTVDWVKDQGEAPWFAWVAYTAPHTPFHVPPAGTHSQGVLSNNQADIDADPKPYFLAMVENLDYEIGRLLNSLDAETKARTLIVFLGDNGTHRQVIQAPYPSSYSSKGTLYQGGIHVPLIVSGTGVTRTGDRESVLISAVDISATLTEALGMSPLNTIDGLSFVDLLTNSTSAVSRTFSLSQFSDTDLSKSGTAIRNSQYKLISFDDSSEVFMDLSSDPFELSALNIGALSIVQQENYDSLKSNLNAELSSGASKNSTNQILTNNSPTCSDHQGSYVSYVSDILETTDFTGALGIASDGTKCTFTTNSIPNHDFNDGSRIFVNTAATVAASFEVVLNPVISVSTTPVSIGADNAVFLNGVKLDILAAACYGVGPDPLGSEKIGCGDLTRPWRYDPMSALNNFGTDSHNAHTQANGSYHYHGNPMALFLNTANVRKASPVIGFSADGFPIMGSLINDNGVIREVEPGYSLKLGLRTAKDNQGAFPGGSYDGTFRDDYEFVGSGDLDECNGMVRDGQYAYYVTNSFPWVIACFKGTPDSSFNK